MSGQNRKFGRNADFCKAYKASGQREKNKTRKLLRHLRHQLNLPLSHHQRIQPRKGYDRYILEIADMIAALGYVPRENVMAIAKGEQPMPKRLAA